VNSEALLVIGAVTLLLALVLAVRGWLLARWLNRRHAGGAGSVRLTRAGLVLYSAQIAILFGVYGWPSFIQTLGSGLF
jgi:hypothetical protein